MQEKLTFHLPWQLICIHEFKCPEAFLGDIWQPFSHKKWWAFIREGAFIRITTVSFFFYVQVWANSVEQDQTATKEAVWSVYTDCQYVSITIC